MPACIRIELLQARKLQYYRSILSSNVGILRRVRRQPPNFTFELWQPCRVNRLAGGHFGFDGFHLRRNQPQAIGPGGLLPCTGSGRYEQMSA